MLAHDKDELDSVLRMSMEKLNQSEIRQNCG